MLVKSRVVTVITRYTEYQLVNAGKLHNRLKKGKKARPM